MPSRLAGQEHVQVVLRVFLVSKNVRSGRSPGRNFTWRLVYYTVTRESQKNKG